LCRVWVSVEFEPSTEAVEDEERFRRADEANEEFCNSMVAFGPALCVDVDGNKLGDAPFKAS
jgi:hypothetical protein